MAKFISKTQEQGMTYFNAPSGVNYTSHRGSTFNVQDERDIAYFESKPTRFKKVLMTKTVVQDEPETDEEQMYNWLTSLKGIGKATADTLVNLYSSKANLDLDVKGGRSLTSDGLTEKQAETIEKALQGEE